MSSPPLASHLARADQHGAAVRDAWQYVVAARGATTPLPGALHAFLIADVLDAGRPSRSCAHDTDGAPPTLWAVVFPAGGVLLACRACVAYLAELVGDAPAAACHLCARELAEPDAVSAVTARGRVVLDVSLCRRCATATGLSAVPAPRGGTE